MSLAARAFPTALAILAVSGCGPSSVATQPSGSRAQTSSTPGAVAISAHIDSVTTDSAGYRVVVVTVVVRGPASVNVAYCGSPAPVNVWAVNAAGKRLSGGRASSQLCMAPKLEPIAAGTLQSFDASAQFAQGSGPVTIHGRIALAGAGRGENLPVLAAS